MLRWKNIDIFPDYEISNAGEVYSKRSKTILKPQSSKRGGNYLFVNLYRKGKRYNRNIHTLVAQAFLQHPDPANRADYVVDHKDGNRKNCKQDNLEYVTHKENARRRDLRAKDKERTLIVTECSPSDGFDCPFFQRGDGDGLGCYHPKRIRSGIAWFKCTVSDLFASCPLKQSPMTIELAKTGDTA